MQPPIATGGMGPGVEIEEDALHLPALPLAVARFYAQRHRSKPGG